MEDQCFVAMAIAMEMQQSNIHVTTAPDGEQALALARQQRFDLILLDQMLPGMDGLEICRRLKSDPALCDIPVIFLTAYPSAANEREAHQLGAVDYLLKGIHPPRLAARILSEVELARDRASRSARRAAQLARDRTFRSSRSAAPDPQGTPTCASRELKA